MVVKWPINIHKIIQLEIMELSTTIKKVIPIFTHHNSKMKKVR